jgi:hypothetical protein
MHYGNSSGDRPHGPISLVRCEVVLGMLARAAARGTMKTVRVNPCCVLMLAIGLLLAGQSYRAFGQDNAEEQQALPASEWMEPAAIDEAPSRAPPAGQSPFDTPVSDGAPITLQRMPRMRRVGALHVVHNTETFRAAYGNPSAALSGFLASPWQGPEAGARLANLIKQASVVSQRFWYLSSLAVVPLSASPSVKVAYEQRFRLDGWVGFTVTFEPDYTRIRLSLFRGKTSELLVSESVEIGPQPSEDDLVGAFVRLWARAGHLVGHLGSIDWQSGDLVSLDVGASLVQTGEQLIAGNVFVDVVHPKSGEVLRTKALPVAQLEVVETHPHTALARITGARHAASVSQMQGLLVWKSPAELGNREPVQSPSLSPPIVPLDSPNSAGGEIIFGQAPKGYGSPPVSVAGAKLNPPGPEHDRDLVVQHNTGEDVTFPQEDGEGTRVRASDSLPPAEQNGEIGDSEPQQNGPGLAGGPMSGSGGGWLDAILEPDRWQQRGALLAIGQSWGTLDTSPCANSPCDRYSGFPNTVFNSVGGGVVYSVTKTADVAFSGEFNLFDGNDVDGYKLSAKALSVHHVGQIGRDVFSLLAGPELSFGSVRTVLADESLFHFALLAGGDYGFRAPELGVFQVGLEFSLFDLIAGDLAYGISFRGRSFFHLPPPFGVAFGLRRASSKWSEITIGLTWEF